MASFIVQTQGLDEAVPFLPPGYGTMLKAEET
jgi:hypothetical protein